MPCRPLTGEIATVELLQGVPAFAQKRRKRRGRMGAGLRYERKVHEFLEKEFDGYMRSPWFRYTTVEHPSREQYAQPDGLIVDIPRGQITICEMKYNHCAEAYFQLVDKYLPLVKAFFNNSELWTFATVEIVYWFDCAVAFPTTPKMRKRLRSVRPNELAVHICRP